MKDSIFYKQKVLVTGGSGMIGRQLVPMLLDKGAEVYVADLNEPIGMPDNINFIKIDLKNYSACIDICKDKDYIFNLVGIKASPKICLEKPASIMGPMMQFNTNMLEAAMQSNIKWYLYTSTVGVYQPSEILREDDVWNTFPSKNDWFGGWAKRMGELQVEAYARQNGKNICSIIRPANVYGPYDNFDIENAMVIPSLIRKADENEILEVWGDGTQIRDFIYAEDVARGMMFAVENKINPPMNLGSGTGVAISQISEIISQRFDKKIKYLTDAPSGDPIRILDMSRAKSYGFELKYSLIDGINKAIDWYLENKNIINKRYNVFH